MAAQKQAQSKAAFVRQLSNLSPKEILAKAKAEGVKLDIGYIYNVRSTSKPKKKAGTKSAAAASTSAARAGRPGAAANAESLLRALGAELGLAHAIAILEAERARVKRVLGA